MEILFHDHTAPVYTDLARMTKQTAVAMESVVPDTKDDIGRILSVRPALYLKSRELQGSRAAVGAEAAVCVLYVNEEENAVSSFTVRQDLVFEFELPAAADDSCLLQCRLGTGGVQSRLLNTRKLSIELEASCTVALSAKTELPVSQEPEECSSVTLHLLEEETKARLLTSVCEKAVSFSEQFGFDGEPAEPEELVYMEKELIVAERQIIADRLLVKGEVRLTVDYLGGGRNDLQRKTLSLPFSQLIDLGEEAVEQAAIRVEWTSGHAELVETIEGKKMLNVDLRALLQLRGTAEKTICSVTDAYCNAMPCVCQSESLSLPSVPDESVVRLSGEDGAELPEDFQTVLAAYLTPGRCSAEKGTVLAELLCLTADNRLSVIRRTVALSGEAEDHFEVNACRVTEFSAEPEGDRIRIAVAAEVLGGRDGRTAIERVCAVDLDESAAFDSSASPSLTAVWAETETVWELAKLYRSSPEAIRACNEDLSVNPVFIPKSK